jgi:hypothetical protein
LMNLVFPLGANTSIYSVYQAGGNTRVNCFKDITSGTNDNIPGSTGVYTAGPGFDMCTGLGSLNGANLYAAIKCFVTPPTAAAHNTGTSTTAPSSNPTSTTPVSVTGPIVGPPNNTVPVTPIAVTTPLRTVTASGAAANTQRASVNRTAVPVQATVQATANVPPTTATPAPLSRAMHRRLPPFLNRLNGGSKTAVLPNAPATTNAKDRVV